MAYNNVGDFEVLTMAEESEIYDELEHVQQFFRRGVILHMCIALMLVIAAIYFYYAKNMLMTIFPAIGVLFFVGFALWSLVQFSQFAGRKAALGRAEEKEVMVTADIWGTYGSYRVTVAEKVDSLRTKHVVCRPAKKWGVMFPLKPFPATFYIDPQTQKVVLVRTEKCLLWP